MSQPAKEKTNVSDSNQVPVRTESKAGEPRSGLQAWQPFRSLRQEMDRLFADFERDWGWPRSLEPFFGRGTSLTYSVPAVDVAETDDAYEITAELPGLVEKDVEVKLANEVLTIKGEKQEEKEEKERTTGYHVSERRYGTFQRSFRIPNGVDVDKIEATFKNGVLKVALPKTKEAQSAVKKIDVRA
jgi:HSP20 family protein